MWPALLLAVAALVDLVLPHPAHVTRAEFGTGFATTIISIAGGLSGLFKGKIDGNVKRALDGMRLTLAVAFEALAHFAKDSGDTQSKSVGLLRRLWDVVIIGFIHHVDTAVRKLHDWLKKTIGPILRALYKIRAQLLKLYDKWLRPIFDTIDVIRHVLSVLSFLHLDFARKADEKLSELEARLRRIILVPLQKLNQVIDQVTLVIDEFGFYQRYTLVRSMVLFERDYWKTVWLSAHRRELENPAGPHVWPPETTPKDFSDSVIAYAGDQSGPDAAWLREYVQDVVLIAERRGA